jgi:hypothetical protein
MTSAPGKVARPLPPRSVEAALRGRRRLHMIHEPTGADECQAVGPAGADHLNTQLLHTSAM